MISPCESLLDIPDVGRNHILLFFPLKIISVREIYSDSLFKEIGGHHEEKLELKQLLFLRVNLTEQFGISYIFKNIWPYQYFPFC